VHLDDLQVASHRRHAGAFTEHPVGSLCFRTIRSGVCLRLAIVGILTSSKSVGNGLSPPVDRSQGIGRCAPLGIQSAERCSECKVDIPGGCGEGQALCSVASLWILGQHQLRASYSTD